MQLRERSALRAKKEAVVQKEQEEAQRAVEKMERQKRSRKARQIGQREAAKARRAAIWGGSKTNKPRAAKPREIEPSELPPPVVEPEVTQPREPSSTVSESVTADSDSTWPNEANQEESSRERDQYLVDQEIALISYEFLRSGYQDYEAFEAAWTLMKLAAKDTRNPSLWPPPPWPIVSPITLGHSP